MVVFNELLLSYMSNDVRMVVFNVLLNVSNSYLLTCERYFSMSYLYNTYQLKYERLLNELLVAMRHQTR